MFRRGRHEKTMKTMDKILLAIGVFLLLFVITMIWLFHVHYTTPDVLITCVFAAATGELGFMSIIQKNKERKQEREWQIEDEKRNRANMIEDEERQRRYMKEDMRNE